MACNYPRLMWRIKSGPSANGKWPLTSDMRHAHDESPTINIPCGRCIGCRLDKSLDWARRCEKEAKYHKQNCFITLTYDNHHLPPGSFEAPTLLKRDLTLFFKRLRKRVYRDYGTHFRYFACGEYGDKSRRPHYHACIFGFDFPDKVHQFEKGGFAYSSSALLSDCWGLGAPERQLITGFSFETAAYVARYTIGKLLGPSRFYYKEVGIVPEYVVMSRGSKILGTKGIGHKFYEEHFSDMFPRDELVSRGGKISKPPKYFMRQLEKDNPELYALIKKRREDAPHRSMALKKRETREAVRLFRLSNFSRDLQGLEQD